MNWKKWGRRLLFPNGWLLMLLTVLCAGGLTAVFLRGLAEHPAAYAMYVLSFYTLTVDCVWCARVLPGRWRVLKAALYGNAWTSRFLTDRPFRARVMMYVSLGVSILYVFMHLLSWHTNRSWWFVVLAVYYSILSLMRFLLVRYVQHHAFGEDLCFEWKRARTCACILLLVNLSLSAAVLMILYQDRGYDYPGVLIYVMALYTFYSTIHAVVDIVKYRRMGSPILSTAKSVSLSAALVSMLNLETAMFSQFGGDMPLEQQRLMIILTGAGVSAVVVTLSLRLILRANKEVRSFSYESE